MSPTIRIDEDVFDALKKHAEPFVDTPNTVLRRLLELGELGELGETGAEMNGDQESDVEVERRPTRRSAAATPRRRQRRRRSKAARAPRAKRGTLLSESEYELPLLQIIAEHGGRSAAREVLDELETRLDGRLTDVDREQLASGDIRWRNRAQFVRLRLVEQGDMVKDSPRGVWEITDRGRTRIKDAA